MTNISASYNSNTNSITYTNIGSNEKVIKFGDGVNARYISGTDDTVSNLVSSNYTTPHQLFGLPPQNITIAANGGTYPPDLSLIIKARPNGANYLHALLSGYEEAPKNIKVPEGMYYNKFYSGNLIAMPQPLYEDGVEYLDGTKASKDQMATDVTTFLAWASEPELEERKQLGVTVILFLIVFSILSYFSMRQIWAPIKNKN